MALENDHGSRGAPAIAGSHRDWRRSVAELVPAADAVLRDKADQIAALFLEQPAEPFVPVPTEPPG